NTTAGKSGPAHAAVVVVGICACAGGRADAAAGRADVLPLADQSEPGAADRGLPALYRVAVLAPARGGGRAATLVSPCGIRLVAGDLRGADVPRLHPDRPSAPLPPAYRGAAEQLPVLTSTHERLSIPADVPPRRGARLPDDPVRQHPAVDPVPPALQQCAGV